MARRETEVSKFLISWTRRAPSVLVDTLILQIETFTVDSSTTKADLKLPSLIETTPLDSLIKLIRSRRKPIEPTPSLGKLTDSTRRRS